MRQPSEASDAIERFTRLADQLSGNAKHLFARATKEFDIGVEAFIAAQPGAWLLATKSVQAARLGGVIRLNVYAPRRRSAK